MASALRSVPRKIWQTLSSIKTGVVLIILVVIFSAAGTVILQRPMTDADDLERAYSPSMLRFLDSTGLTDVFHTRWFVALLILVCLSIVAASVERFPNAWRFFARPYKGPDGGTIMTIRVPSGCMLRFVHQDMQNAASRLSDNRPTRLAHVNLNATDVDGSAAFYEQALGFRQTDRTKAMAFLRCNNDHHAVVIADAPVNGLNHVAFMMPDLEAVMRSSGHMIDAGFPIAWGVGRHGPGNNVFAYFVDPVGIVIEYTAEVLQVDDRYAVRGPSEWVWPPGRTDHWGIAPPKTDQVKAAQIAVPYANA